jgi:cyclopropane fatty-acyl-phospholipid synthase-like methyltransferase
LTEEAKEEFFLTGDEHIEKVWNEIEKHFIENFRPKRGLDFGCGVGRLVVPLAERCERVVGVDISDLMIEEAQKNCRARGIENVSFSQTDKFFAEERGDFDLIHSFIVLQHIQPRIGGELVGKMLKMLSLGGIGVLHYTYFNPTSSFNYFRFKIYRDYPLVNRLKNFVKGEKHQPFIPVYIYDLNAVFADLQENDCHKCFIRYSFHGFNGAVIFFQKEKSIIF